MVSPRWDEPDPVVGKGASHLPDFADERKMVEVGAENDAEIRNGSGRGCVCVVVCR